MATTIPQLYFLSSLLLLLLRFGTSIINLLLYSAVQREVARLSAVRKCVNQLLGCKIEIYLNLSDAAIIRLYRTDIRCERS